VKAVIDFKRRVCKNGESFVVINQKGIDPLSLDMFAKEGIIALRRAKVRPQLPWGDNMMIGSAIVTYPRALSVSLVTLKR
jgi:chaperonin GroEL (HSP60 family)